jgi:16S rRNA pseudouridine516 synthase
VRLDRFLGKQGGTGRNRARQAIIDGRVSVDGVIEKRIDREVDRFLTVAMDGAVVQQAERILHLMLHKPLGVLSATRDERHPTVIDLIDDPDKHTLHIVGRLDRATSGLILLTNDGRWSKRLMDPMAKVAKVYLVETRDPIPPSAVAEFERGFYFHTEDLTTRPAELEILGPRQARLTLHEGRYHQVKRMFHRIGNRVTALHREKIGRIALPDGFKPGHWRHLEPHEVDSIFHHSQTGPTSGPENAPGTAANSGG